MFMANWEQGYCVQCMLRFYVFLLHGTSLNLHAARIIMEYIHPHVLL